LHIAAAAEDFSLVQLLCTHGADMHAVSNRGETPLQGALRKLLSYGKILLIKYFLIDFHKQDPAIAVTGHPSNIYWPPSALPVYQPVSYFFSLC